jgi:hypothetical protein
LETTDRKLRMPEPLRSEIEARAAANGVSMNAEMIGLMHSGIERERERRRDEDVTRQTLAMMLGEDDAGLTLLLVQVLRELQLRGRYLDDPAAFDDIGRAIGHLLRRLRAPNDGHVIIDDDGSPEWRIDRLLFDLGTQAPDRTPPSYIERLAAEKRRQFGPALGNRLIEMHDAVRVYLESLPTREPPPADPAIAASWDAAMAPVAEASDAVTRQRGEAEAQRRPDTAPPRCGA